MKRALLQAIAGWGLCALMAPGWAQACSIPADKRPMAERLAREKVVFIGVVESYFPGFVEFRVEEGIKGVETGLRLALPVPAPSSCARVWTAGERWLYAGASLAQPSMRLDGALGKETRRALNRMKEKSASAPMPAALSRASPIPLPAMPPR